MAAAERRTYRDDRGAGVAHAAGRRRRSPPAPALALRRVTAGRRRRRSSPPSWPSPGACWPTRRRRDRRRPATAATSTRARALLPDAGRAGPERASTPSGVARAVVESVAENTVDAVVAPACWAAALGAPGVLAHRAVNTLDAMVGHRSARYARFGWAAARLDDAAAWVPARLTAARRGGRAAPLGRRGVAGRAPRRARPTPPPTPAWPRRPSPPPSGSASAASTATATRSRPAPRSATAAHPTAGRHRRRRPPGRATSAGRWPPRWPVLGLVGEGRRTAQTPAVAFPTWPAAS